MSEEDYEAVIRRMDAAREELAAKRKERRQRELVTLDREHPEWLTTPQTYRVCFVDEVNLEFPGIVIMRAQPRQIDLQRWKQNCVHTEDAESKIIAWASLAASSAVYPEERVLKQMFEAHASLPEALGVPLVKASEAAAGAAKKG